MDSPSPGVSTMPVALFDLDNTLLAGDSDYLWGVFLGEIGVVDPEVYARENERFYREYKEGRLDIMEFLHFALRPLKEHSLEQLLQWRAGFLREKIDPIILPAARRLVDSHRRRGDRLVIITATNAFVTAPIAERLGVPHLIATEPERLQDCYTGEVSGLPCFREGKVERLHVWLKKQGENLEGSTCYSDSHNDLPLLSLVEYPVAVDPDPQLQQHAHRHGWPIISLRA